MKDGQHEDVTILGRHGLQRPGNNLVEFLMKGSFLWIAVRRVVGKKVERIDGCVVHQDLGCFFLVSHLLIDFISSDPVQPELKLTWLSNVLYLAVHLQECFLSQVFRVLSGTDKAPDKVVNRLREKVVEFVVIFDRTLLSSFYCFLNLAWADFCRH